MAMAVMAVMVVMDGDDSDVQASIACKLYVSNCWVSSPLKLLLNPLSRAWCVTRYHQPSEPLAYLHRRGSGLSLRVDDLSTRALNELEARRT
jgi:hypothetical protein